MAEGKINYNDVGLKSGLEIHQQLNTSKLFCECPSVLRKDEPEFTVKRRLHVVPGESGEVDVAAAYEASLEKDFTYEAYDTTCLVELDEEPPHEINEESLDIALQIALLLNCKIVPLSQVMRKTVVNGSNTSGFQRTVLIAKDGYLETSEGRVGIDTICLEEDSARIIDKEEGIFRLDRLGIPLVEIATKPDIKTPRQAKEVALYLGEVLRSCNVKRGIGTIRQDVNLSIKGGERVELKGFQDIRNVEWAMEIEIQRQIKLVREGKSILEVRNVLPDGKSKFLRPLPGPARMYPETDLPLLKISRDMINKAKKKLPGLKKDSKKYLEKKGLNEEMISLLLKQKKVEEFKELVGVLDNSNLVAKVLLVFPKEISKREGISYLKVEKGLSKDVLAHILEQVKKGDISERDVKHVMERIVKGDDHKKALEIERENPNAIEEKILKIIKEKPGLSVKAYMGLVMKEFKGKISGKDVSEMIRRYVSDKNK